MTVNGTRAGILVTARSRIIENSVLTKLVQARTNRNDRNDKDTRRDIHGRDVLLKYEYNYDGI